MPDSDNCGLGSGLTGPIPDPSIVSIRQSVAPSSQADTGLFDKPVEGNVVDSEDRSATQRPKLRLVAGLPASLSGREARNISKEIVRIHAPQITAARLQELWAGAAPTNSEVESLQAWTEYCANEAKRIGDQNAQLRWYLWRLAAGSLALAVVVLAIYLVTHAGYLISQLTGVLP